MSKKVNFKHGTLITAIITFAEAATTADSAIKARDASRIILDKAIKDARAAKIKIEPRCNKNSYALQIRTALETVVAKSTAANYLTALRRAINDGKVFSLNHSRDKAKSTGSTGKTKAGSGPRLPTPTPTGKGASNTGKGASNTGKAGKVTTVKPLGVATRLDSVLDAVAFTAKQTLDNIVNHKELVTKHDARIVEYLEYLAGIQG